MNDMKQTIIPKSDQLNADDLISGPMTIKITKVAIRAGQEQPISILFEGDNGKPYKPCKSMCRVMVTAWGADSKRYAGRSMTLYRDPAVKWGGMEVGGIRITHMSDIDSALTMALTMTRANKKPFTVKPLVEQQDAATSPANPGNGEPVPDDAKLIADVDAWIAKRKFKAAGEIASFISDDSLKAATLERITEAYNAARTAS